MAYTATKISRSYLFSTGDLLVRKKKKWCRMIRSVSTSLRALRQKQKCRDPGIPGPALHPLTGRSLQIVKKWSADPSDRLLAGHPHPQSAGSEAQLLEIFHQETNLDEMWALRKKGGRLPHICLDFPLQMPATVLARLRAPCLPEAHPRQKPALG